MRHLFAVIATVICLLVFGLSFSGLYIGSPVDPNTFKRVWDERFIYLHPKSFITPEVKEVKEAYNDAMRSSVFGSPPAKVRKWIAGNIGYLPDSKSHAWYDCLARNGDLNEYWQYPKETLDMRSGDCEDVATLMTSMLRAGGYSSDDVFVVLGSDGEMNHAWVIVDDVPYEPIAGTTLERMYGDYAISKLNAYYKFNDEKFYKIPESKS
jgi:hypothetical protein